jgi:hypothetical protein
MFSNFVFAIIIVTPILTVVTTILIITNRVGLTAILIIGIKIYYLQYENIGIKAYNIKINEITNTQSEVADEENVIDHIPPNLGVCVNKI